MNRYSNPTEPRVSKAAAGRVDEARCMESTIWNPTEPREAASGRTEHVRLFKMAQVEDQRRTNDHNRSNWLIESHTQYKKKQVQAISQIRVWRETKV